MPQADVFFNEADRQALVEYLLCEGATLIPHVDYDEPRYVLIHDKETYRYYSKQTTLFSIVMDSYLRSPLELRSIEKEAGRPKYCLMQRNGGPTIDFYCPGEFEEGGSRYIGPGMIGYYPTYWNTIAQQNEKAPKGLLEAYRSITARIGMNAVRVTGKARTYWIGTNAVEAVRHGVRLVGLEDLKL